jgi:hypothetical protein
LRRRRLRSRASRRPAEEEVAVSFALAVEEEPAVVEEEEVAVSRLAQAGVIEVDSERGNILLIITVRSFCIFFVS